MLRLLIAPCTGSAAPPDNSLCRYSQDGLHAGLADLTGADRRRGQVLAALQEEGLLDVHIALARRVDWGELQLLGRGVACGCRGAAGAVQRS